VSHLTSMGAEAFPLSTATDGPWPLLAGLSFAAAYVAGLIRPTLKDRRARCAGCGGRRARHVMHATGLRYCQFCAARIEREARRRFEAGIAA
jgi:hypothetical protein